jgi:glycerol-3-phosphate dehydrogenase
MQHEIGMRNPIEIQVLIVGAGTTGLAIARELSRYKVDVMVVEKNVDVCLGEVRGSHGFVYSSTGISWANSLILKSIITPDIPPSQLFHRDSLKTRLTADGFNVFPSLAEELEIGFKLSRRVIVGKDEEDFKALEILEEICRSMDIIPERLDQEGIQALEPYINKDFTRGLTQYGDAGHVYPWEYGIALGENARANGVRIMLGTEVQAITSVNGGFRVQTTRGPITTRFIVNAAGSYGDRIAEMAGVRDFGLTYYKFQMLISDKRLGGMVHNIAAKPYRPGHSTNVSRTLSGNLYISAYGYLPATGPEDTEAKMEWMDLSLNNIQELFPDIHKQDLITSFVGVGVFNTRDPENHLVEVSKKNPNFLNAITRMPGLAPSPAIAKYIAELMGNQGLELVEKDDFNPHRKRIPRVSELSDQERSHLISQNPRYGRIICSCEQVTEGEIVEAIGRGARTVQGVKYRTRAGMGRCQANHCGPRVTEILARELDIPMAEVTHKGALSRSLLHRSEELLSLGG